jgi:hypothetical protein
MSKSLNNVKASIGGAETTAGTAVSRTAVIPIRGMPTLRKSANKQVDPVIAGRNMDAAEFSTAYPVGGSIPLSPRPAAGFGMLLNAWLGQEQASPDQIAACIRIRYTGSEASCKISASASGDTIDSDVGDKGSETGDTNFGTSGSIDLTAASTDTVGELVSTIDGYTDYEAETLFGDTSTDAAEILDITSAQGKNQWVYVWFGSASSGFYRHTWEVVLTNTERDTFSVQVDGMHDNYLYDGVIVDAMSFNAALQGLLEAEAEVLGFDEATGQSAYSGDDLESYGAYIFQHGGFSLRDVDYTYLRSISFNGTNGSTQDGYGQGSLLRQYHEKNKFDLTGSFQLRYSSDVYANRARVFNDAVVALSFYFKTNSDLATNIPGILLFEMPNIQLSDYQETERDGKIDASVNFRAVNPDGAYDSPFRITMITDDSAVYH